MQTINRVPEGPKVLVTGANGFIGHHVCAALEAAGYGVRRAIRMKTSADVQLPADTVETGDVGPYTDWTDALSGVDFVIHLAAHVHRVRSKKADANQYFRVNEGGTRALAAQACRLRVKRFVFLSSIKVHGESTSDIPFRSSDIEKPIDTYGQSKLAGEIALREIANLGQMDWVIVRPPLVYGPGVGANFYRLLALVDRGVPMPFKNMRNRRSLLSIRNLCDFLLHVLKQPEAANRTFLVSDNEDLSTCELISKIANAMSTKALLFPVPTPILTSAGRLFGIQAEVARLTQSLQVDATQTRTLLGWEPVESVDQAITSVVQWYEEKRH
jgi:nucleoside-diphosphate-sugar epimerase